MNARWLALALLVIAPQSIAASVALQVSGEQATAAIVRAHLERELGAIDGLSVVAGDAPANYLMDVIAIDARNTQGERTGIAVSVVVFRSFDNTALLELVSVRTRRQAESLTARLQLFETHWLEMGAVADLEQMCKAVAAGFDSKVLRH